MTTRQNVEGARSSNMVHTEFRYLTNTETLGAGKTLLNNDPTLQYLDPGGSGRTIILPAEADSEGLVFILSNTADAAETLTVNDDGGSTIALVTQGELAMFTCDGVNWDGGSLGGTGVISTDDLADSAVTLAKMAANSVDSDQYVDGSVDGVHISAATITNLLLDLSSSITLLHIAHDASSPVEILAADGANVRTVAIIVALTEDMAGGPEVDIGETDTVNKFLDDFGAGVALQGECYIAVGTLTAAKALICTIATAGSGGEFDVIVIIGG